MKTITNVLIFLVVAGGIFFGYKMLKSSETPDNESSTNNDNDVAEDDTDRKIGATYAILVGISDYKYLSPRPQNGPPKPNTTYDLNFCDDDANLFYDFLRSPLGGNVSAENIVKLLDSQATKTNIISQMNRIFSKSTTNDRVIFYFTGHGSFKVLCPYDVGNTISTALEYETISAAFRLCRAKDRLFIADACNTGSMKIKHSGHHANHGAPLPKGKTLVEFMASKAHQSSQENPRLKHGCFTYFLDRGARGEADENGDKIVTIKELHKFVKIKVEAETRRHIHPNAPDKDYQTPIVFGKFPENMPFSNLN